MIVMKFGGTSVGDGQRIKEVARIVSEHVREHGPVAVVVSAMSGVTDALLRAAHTAAAGDSQTYREVRAALSRQHQVAIQECLPDGPRRHVLSDEIETLLDWLTQLCRSIHILGELTPRGRDAVAALGERISVRLVAAAMREMGLPTEVVEATQLIVTDDHFGHASPLMPRTCEQTRQRLQPLLEEGVVPVVTGFIGATEEGVITTLGRGGSDYSAAIIGRCLEAEEIWIWTDVDGVMTADPRLVPEARTLPRISYAEAAELSHFGAKVLHPKTILPAVEVGIPIRVKNTFNPTHPGTVIDATGEPSPMTVKGITAINGLSLITVEGRGMLGVPGVAGRLFSTVAAQGTSVLMISQASSEQSICFLVKREEAPSVIAALEETFARELARRDIDRIWAQEPVSIIAVVGAGMKGTPGIAARVFGALADKGINVISIAQGSSEYNISLVVDDAAMGEAVRAIHQRFELGKG